MQSMTQQRQQSTQSAVSGSDDEWGPEWTATGNRDAQDDATQNRNLAMDIG